MRLALNSSRRVKLHEHPHRTEWRDFVRLLGTDDAWHADQQNLFAGRFQNAVEQAALNYVYERPDTGFGAVLAAQTCRQAVLVENRRLLVGCQSSGK